MSRRPAISPSRDHVGAPTPLPLLREADVTGLVLWAALLMAGSVAFAFLSTAPAHARPEAAVSAAPAEKATAATASQVPGPAPDEVGGGSPAPH